MREDSAVGAAGAPDLRTVVWVREGGPCLLPFPAERWVHRASSRFARPPCWVQANDDLPTGPARTEAEKCSSDDGAAVAGAGFRAHLITSGPIQVAEIGSVF